MSSEVRTSVAGTNGDHSQAGDGDQGRKETWLETDINTDRTRDRGVEMDRTRDRVVEMDQNRDRGAEVNAINPPGNQSKVLFVPLGSKSKQKLAFLADSSLGGWGL